MFTQYVRYWVVLLMAPLVKNCLFKFLICLTVPEPQKLPKSPFDVSHNSTTFFTFNKSYQQCFFVYEKPDGQLFYHTLVFQQMLEFFYYLHS